MWPWRRSRGEVRSARLRIVLAYAHGRTAEASDDGRRVPGLGRGPAGALRAGRRRGFRDVAGAGAARSRQVRGSDRAEPSDRDCRSSLPHDAGRNDGPHRCGDDLRAGRARLLRTVDRSRCDRSAQPCRRGRGAFSRRGLGRLGRETPGLFQRRQRRALSDDRPGQAPRDPPCARHRRADRDPHRQRGTTRSDPTRNEPVRGRAVCRSPAPRRSRGLLRSEADVTAAQPRIRTPG